MPIFADPTVDVSSFINSWNRSLPAPEKLFSGGAPIISSSAADDQWTPDLSSDLYNVPGWGQPYFSVNSTGNISIKPCGSASLHHQEIDIMKVVKKAIESKSEGGLGLQMPVILRFPDILKHRLESLQSAFDFAIQTNGYNSRYQGVYPVKCNQDRYMVEDIVEFGSPYRFGLEAGSKPELLLAMSCLTKGNHDAYLICNGYKDEEYVSLALTALTLKLNAIIVLEQEEELDTVISNSIKLGARPVIGFRAKLRTKHSGHFGSTSGEKGKFGLTTTQILSVARKLQRYEMLDCLQLLHFHIGSQIPSTALLSDGVAEAAQIYCELVRLGAPMRVIDIGGGLGIDYDGSKSGGSDMSIAYTLDEYALAVVGTIQFICDSKQVHHPIICSESGRALISHHSVLVFEATPSTEMGSARPDICHLTEGLAGEARAEYMNLSSAIIDNDFTSCLIHADNLKSKCVDLFKEGLIGLDQLAAVDTLYDYIFKEVGSFDPVTAYHVNLSIFTSVPDFWAIGQLFPILPIHRLNEKPKVKGVLSDLTCDSDGKINRFINGKESLPLHEGNGNGYYLGMFLGGAYQEALGGLHNLFGGPSMVRVVQSEGAHCFAVTHAAPGSSCADVLRVMQYEPEVMYEVLKSRVEEEYGDGGSHIACRLDRAFGSMPYLVGSSFGCSDDTEGDGYVDHCGNELESSGTESVTDEDEGVDWDMMNGLSM